MKKLLIFSIFLLSFDGLIAQIKVSELSATPVDVLNNYYIKGGSLNGKYKMSLEKVMVNEISTGNYLDFNSYDMYWNFFDYFTGIGKNLFYYTSLTSDYKNSENHRRVPQFIPTIFDKSELNIFRGSNDIPSILSVQNYVNQKDDNNTVNKDKLFLGSKFDDILKLSPTVEITRDKLVEITLNDGEINYYLLNLGLELNNIGTKTVQLFLANEKVNAEEVDNNYRNEFLLNKNDFLWRLFNIKNEIYLILTFRDLRELQIPIPSFIDMINYDSYNKETFSDNWDKAFFGNNTFYFSPKIQNIDETVYLEPRFCLFFFKLKAVN
jgi:hypothetical protein